MRMRLPALALAVLLVWGCGGGGGGGPAASATPTDPAAAPAIAERSALVPGSDETLHEEVLVTAVGDGATAYHLFEPSAPAPASAPVVIFLHGYTIVDPAYYRAFIDHIVRRGNTVVYPRYQAFPLSIDTGNFTPNAVAAIRGALATLADGSHVEPELMRVAVLGHSFGGVISANVAARAADEGLPSFRAVMPMMPGTAGFGAYEDYAKIPAGTLLLSVTGEDDDFVGDTDAKRIYNGASSIPAADKDYVLMRSDRSHSPALVADHSAPGAPTDADADALDRQGFWKWFDGLVAAAFYGTFREYALGDTPEQRSLGTWPDDEPIAEPTVTDHP